MGLLGNSDQRRLFEGCQRSGTLGHGPCAQHHKPRDMRMQRKGPAIVAKAVGPLVL